MNLDYNIIGERLRKIRIDQNLTQDYLAQKMGVSVAFLSRIECGSTHINLKRLSEICNILNVTEGEILNGTSSNQNQYLIAKFNELLKDCPPEKLETIYNITKVILEKN